MQPPLDPGESRRHAGGVAQDQPRDRRGAGPLHGRVADVDGTSHEFEGWPACSPSSGGCSTTVRRARSPRRRPRPTTTRRSSMFRRSIDSKPRVRRGRPSPVPPARQAPGARPARPVPRERTVPPEPTVPPARTRRSTPAPAPRCSSRRARRASPQSHGRTRRPASTASRSIRVRDRGRPQPERPHRRERRGGIHRRRCSQRAGVRLQHPSRAPPGPAGRRDRCYRRDRPAGPRRPDRPAGPGRPQQRPLRRRRHRVPRDPGVR